MNSSIREILKDKKRIVIKIGSSSLTHPETGALNLTKLEVLVREISDLHNMGKDVIVVSSGRLRSEEELQVSDTDQVKQKKNRHVLQSDRPD